MCIQNTLQSKIAEATNDGETIAYYLADTLQGNAPDIKTCHKLDAAKLLTKYGFPAAANDNVVEFPSPSTDEGKDEHESTANPEPTQVSVRPEPVEGQDHASADEPHTQNPTNPVHPVSEPVQEPTLYDIVAYPVARYIREATDDGATLIDALCDVMRDNGEYDNQAAFGPSVARPPAKPRHRLAAAKELLRRAFGESTRRRSATAYDPAANMDDADPINGHLAKLIRDKTDDGVEAAELMIRIAENDDLEGDWTSAHRVSTAMELLHRAYDLNYDAVTWEHVEAYKRATDFADEGETLDHARVRAGRAALLREFKEAYEAGDEEAAQIAEDKYNAYNRYIRQGNDPEEAMKYASYGPSDPDPETEQDQLSRRSVRPEPIKGLKANSVGASGRLPNTAALIQSPKLTIPLHKKSLPP